MEPVFRGLLEKWLDEILKPDVLETMAKSYDLFEPLIKSKQDAMFGDIVGTVIERYAHLMVYLKKDPTQDEFNELLDIILRRADEIRSKILMATST